MYNQFLLRENLSPLPMLSYDGSPGASNLVMEFKIESASDFVLDGTSVTSWINNGLNGINANQPIVAQAPTYDSTNNVINFDAAANQFLQFEAPTVLNGDTGWSMILGFDSASLDRDLIGSSNTDGFRIFIRSNSINILTGSTTVAVCNYSGWDTRRTGKVLLEITHLGASAPVGSRLLLRQNNGPSYTGTSGNILADRSFIDRIGLHLSLTGSSYNAEYGYLGIYNKPFANNIVRLSAYNRAESFYTPS